MFTYFVGTIIYVPIPWSIFYLSQRIIIIILPLVETNKKQTRPNRTSGFRIAQIRDRHINIVVYGIPFEVL